MRSLNFTESCCGVGYMSNHSVSSYFLPAPVELAKAPWPACLLPSWASLLWSQPIPFGTCCGPSPQQRQTLYCLHPPIRSDFPAEPATRCILHSQAHTNLLQAIAVSSGCRVCKTDQEKIVHIFLPQDQVSIQCCFILPCFL